MKNYLDTFISMFSKEKDKKTKTQNLIFLVIILVFALICINNMSSNNLVETSSKSKENEQSSNNLETSNYNDIEENLKNILSQINNVSDVSVMLTYSSNETMIPVYDIKEDTTIEENSNGDETNTSKKTTTEKTVAYEEVDGQKVAIVESKKSPKVIGAIITANGIDSSNISKIKEAVSNALDIPVYKVEIFSK